MATLQDQNQRNNPGQDEYEKNFDFEQHEKDLAHTDSNSQDNPAERASMDRAQAWSRDTRPVAERESAPGWDNNVTNKSTPRGPSKKPGRFSMQNMLKKRANQWIAGGIITSVIAFLFGAPAILSQAVINLREVSGRWGPKNTTSSFQQRTGNVLQKKLFQADKNCTSGIVCRFGGKGISDKEIDKFKSAGFTPEVGQDGKSKFLKSLSFTGEGGNLVKVDANNFLDHYGSDVKFKATMDSIAKPSSMLLRGKQVLSGLFDRFRINRKSSIPGNTDEERTKSFRSDIYGEDNPNLKATSVADDDKQGNASKIDGIDQKILDDASLERQRIAIGEGPSIIPDTTNLDASADKEVDVAKGIFKDGLKSAAFGIASAFDKVCSVYQLERAVEFGAKIYKFRGLIKYAGLIMSLVDKVRLGQSGTQEIALIGKVLFTPSVAKDSYGKTAFQSEGYYLITQGKIHDHRGLARWTLGTGFLNFLQKTKQKLKQLGATRDTCKQVKSWYGQAALLIAGLSTDILSGGTLSVVGLVAGAGVGMLLSVMTAYVTPMLIQYAAGTVSPDPNDPEGGYGAGNAFGAGIGALGKVAGGVSGDRMLSNDDATGVEMESNKVMAFQNQVDNLGKSPFSLDSSTSITNQFAMALAPVLSSPVSQNTAQTLASIIASPFSLFGSSFSQLLTHGVNAQSDVNRGGEYCADEDYIQMNLATDAFCTPIPGEKSSTLDDPKYKADVVDKWMVANGHVNNADGTPKSDDYKKYLASCSEGVIPLSPDGGDSGLGEAELQETIGGNGTTDIDTRWCMNPDFKFTMFRMFMKDNAIDSSWNDSIDGTLGQDTGTPNLTL